MECVQDSSFFKSKKIHKFHKKWSNAKWTSHVEQQIFLHATTINNGEPMISFFFFFKYHIPYYRENVNQKRLLLLITVTSIVDSETLVILRRRRKKKKDKRNAKERIKEGEEKSK